MGGKYLVHLCKCHMQVATAGRGGLLASFPVVTRGDEKQEAGPTYPVVYLSFSTEYVRKPYCSHRL